MNPNPNPTTPSTKTVLDPDPSEIVAALRRTFDDHERYKDFPKEHREKLYSVFAHGASVMAGIMIDSIPDQPES